MSELMEPVAEKSPRLNCRMAIVLRMTTANKPRLIAFFSNSAAVPAMAHEIPMSPNTEAIRIFASHDNVPLISIPSNTRMAARFQTFAIPKPGVLANRRNENDIDTPEINTKIGKIKSYAVAPCQWLCPICFAMKPRHSVWGKF